MSRTVAILKFLVRGSSLFFISLVSLFASPTENEFDSCKKIATMTLEYCLNDSPHYNNQDCWQESSSHYSSCVDKIKARHIKNNEKIEAGKKGKNERVKWRWNIERAALYDSVLSITQDKKLLSSHELPCDLSDALRDKVDDESAASIDTVITKSNPNGILIVTCSVGAHSEHLLIVDPFKNVKSNDFNKVGSYFVDWYVKNGQLWIRYDEPCEIKHDNECDVPFSTAEIPWPQGI